MYRTIISPRSTAITQQFALNGLRILNTRPQHQAAGLSQIIRAAGGLAIEFPTLEIQSLSKSWQTTLPPWSNIHTAIFVSTNAVHYFFAGLQNQNIHWPTGLKTFAIGQATADALRHYHVEKIQVPECADSEHLLAEPALQHVQQHTILLISGEKSRPLLATTLRKRGAQVQQVAVYRRVLPKKNLPLAHKLWQDDAVDIILILSHEAIDNLFLLFEKEAKPWLQSKPWVVISPRLVELAHHYQVRTVILSSYSEILNTLVRIRHEHGRRTQ